MRIVTATEAIPYRLYASFLDVSSVSWRDDLGGSVVTALSAVERRQHCECPQPVLLSASDHSRIGLSVVRTCIAVVRADRDGGDFTGHYAGVSRAPCESYLR